MSRRLREVLGDTPAYEIKAAGEPLVDVLKRLREATKAPFRMDDVPLDLKLTLDAKSSNLFELLSRVGEASKEVDFDPVRRAVIGAPAAARPGIFKDRWGILLSSIRVEIKPEAAQTFASADFVATWDTLKRPNAVQVRLKEAVTDTGDSIYLGTEDSAPVGNQPTADGPSTADLYFSLSPPPAETRSITFRGEAEFEYYIEETVVNLGKDWPDDPPVIDSEIGWIKPIDLFGDHEYVNLYLQVTPKAGSPAIGHGSFVVRAIDNAGRVHTGETQFMSDLGSGAGEFDVFFESLKKSSITRIELVYPKRKHVVTIPFEFKDVRIR